jgi:hypothetical protein
MTPRATTFLIAAGLAALAWPALALNPNGAATYYYMTEAGDPTGVYPELMTTHSYPVGGSRTQSDETTLGTTAISKSIDSSRDFTGFRISASATAIPDVSALPGIADRSYAEAETNIIFYITAVGPAGTQIPVDVKALLEASGSEAPNYAFGIYGIGTAYTGLEIRDNVTDSPPDDYVWANCPFPGCTQTTTLNVNQTIDLIANKTYEVQESVFVTAGAYTTTDGTQTASASADPQFGIPYGYQLDNPGVSLTISPGLEGLVVVPEPGTWALMLAGLGLAGITARRRMAMAPARAALKPFRIRVLQAT